ncbi:MltF family protein [Nitrospira japonica]|uniref:transglycosylase SLT domain-containing protein n=1 Tax=Nitrospira japonica TaxID=1325564 RepID=UPI0018D4417B|nr:transporter substrate-binding domain-containing protein [Nitrospira japonica]
MKRLFLATALFGSLFLVGLPTPQSLAAALQSSDDHDLVQSSILRPWTGDLDGMVERRVIRALVAPSRTSYWLNGARQTGAEYELLKAFQEEINAKYQSRNKHILVHVVFIPTSRDQLIPALLEGRGDIAAGILTVTPERLEKVDFGEPFFRGVKEIVVTGPASPNITSLSDLSGKEVFVRKSSSYWSHLERLNEQFAQEQKAPVILKPAPEDLQDDDLLEMVNAGLVEIIVVDRYQALLWSKVFKKLVAHKGVVLNAGGDFAWMLRKDSPKLKAEIDEFAKKYGRKSEFGNALVKKYGGDGNPRIVKQATSGTEIKKFSKTVDLFRKYGAQYEMDYLLMIAQGYQESLLDQNARSNVGAVGVMQLMPATGNEMKTGDITQLEPNIHAGIKYVRYIRDQFFENEDMDSRNKILFSFAAYNAGPARVQKLRKEAEKRGLNPNVWFNNVELIAARRIGEETVTYVANIYKYYIAYKLVEEQRAEKEKRRADLQHDLSGPQ